MIENLRLRSPQMPILYSYLKFGKNVKLFHSTSQEENFVLYPRDAEVLRETSMKTLLDFSYWPLPRKFFILLQKNYIQNSSQEK